MILDTPDELKSLIGLMEYSYLSPDTFVLNIRSEDYERGYVFRYFVGTINYNSVIETNIKNYNVVNTNFYRKAKVEWKITGPAYSLYKGKTLEVLGVVPHNLIQIDKAKKIIPNIEVVLNNPKQFWRGY